jgi:hypothetical protein
MKGEEAYLHLRASTGSLEDAKNIEQVLLGVVALGRMVVDSDEAVAAQLEPLIDAISIDRDVREITISIQGDPLKMLEGVAMVAKDM